MSVLKHLGGIFDFDLRKEELDEVNRELEQPGVWDDPENAQKLGKERSRLEKIVVTIEELVVFSICYLWLVENIITVVVILDLLA